MAFSPLVFSFGKMRDIDEFYVTAPVAEREKPIYRRLAEPSNPPEVPDFGSHRLLDQLLL